MNSIGSQRGHQRLGVRLPPRLEPERPVAGEPNKYTIFLTSAQICTNNVLIRIPKRAPPLSACLEAVFRTAPPQRQEGHAYRLEKIEREKTIVNSLNRGQSVLEIAAPVGVSERVRCIVHQTLACRPSVSSRPR